MATSSQSIHGADAGAERRGSSVRFDPTSIDLTDFDIVRAVRDVTSASEAVGNRALDLAKDATYVTVGFGLLTYQRAQVRRREFERARRR